MTLQHMSSNGGNFTALSNLKDFCFKQNIDADAMHTCAVCKALAHTAPLLTLVNQSTAYACPKTCIVSS